MDACPLLITSIVAVKPEDQGTFFQDFLGLSGYLCSIGGFYSNTALLRTRNAQNHNEAQRPRDEPPGQLFDTSMNPIRRNWPGRLQRVVRPLAKAGAV